METQNLENRSASPYLSIVIPARNAARTLTDCLEAIRRSSFRDYELVVVDDGSADQTAEIAARYADKVIRHEASLGAPFARKAGASGSAGDIIVGIDSDVIIAPDTLSIIGDHFRKNPLTDAIVGRLAKSSPYNEFFTQYKNLYMNYIFGRLPREITFIYGSIHAVRKTLASTYPYNRKSFFAEDTEFGQRLMAQGKKIIFLKELEVTHLKRYSFISFIRNDFLVASNWANIFLRYGGWRQIMRRKTGFAHSPKWQIISVVLAPIMVIITAGSLFWHPAAVSIIPLCALWCILNMGFILFLISEKGIYFAIKGICVNFIDNIIMACGILYGFLRTVTGGKY